MLSDGRDPETVWPVLHDENNDSEEARWRSLYFAVQALPDDQRQVINLAYYQGMSQSEMAEELGWPIGTVKTRMRAALQALRRDWSREDQD